MCRFIESIKIKNGEIFNLELHGERLVKTVKENFGCREMPDLSSALLKENIPDKGLYKCRVVYGETIISIDVEKYKRNIPRRIKIIHSEEIDYYYKNADRSRIEELKEACPGFDDILIIKNGFVTDSSYCNIVFQKGNKFYTPSTPLLRGTKREELLRRNIIHEKTIREKDIALFDCLHFINAMNDIGNITVGTGSIF